MSIFIRRTIAVLAALLLAGASIGCDREASDEGVTMGGPGDPEPAQDEEQQEVAPEGEAHGEDEQGGIGAAPQPGLEGQQPGEQGQALQQVRDEVASELDIPTSAVIIEEQVRQNITQATSDVQRRGWGIVSTVEAHLQRLNTNNLEQEEQQAADQLRQQVSTARQTLEQVSQAGQEQASQLEDQLDTQLSDIGDNWGEISDKMQFQDQPAGGGPLESEEGMDNPSEGMENNQNLDGQMGTD